MSWDAGVSHQTWEIVPDTKPIEPLDVTFVATHHLRLSSTSADLEYVAHLIRAARLEAERVTWRSLVTKQYRMVLNQFPCGRLELDYPPLQAVESFAYVDEDGATQTLTEDTDFYVITPEGPTAGRAAIHPTFDTTWPTTRAVADAVRITFRAGYVDGSSPPESNVPDDILDGMLLWIGERHKLRSLSVHAFNQAPAVIQAEALWKRYRAY